MPPLLHQKRLVILYRFHKFLPHVNKPSNEIIHEIMLKYMKKKNPTKYENKKQNNKTQINKTEEFIIICFLLNY